MLKRLFLGNAMRNCADNLPAEQGSLHNILEQARTYTKVRMLHSTKLVSIADVKPVFKAQNYPERALEKLKSVDIFTLPMSKEEEFS